MESGRITDDQITASSADVGFPPSAARLHGNGSWIPSIPQSSWLQLTGNVDADSVVEHLFSGRIQAQRIKVTPLQFHVQASLRLEIIGCDVPCRNLTAPDNGNLSPEGVNYYQDEVTFTCNQGYELIGASSVTCQADQTWSGSVPTCLLTACVHGETLALTDLVTEGFITSPNYPDIYPNNIDCSWTITAPSTSRIQLDFVTFGIEYGNNCQYDFVHVLEGHLSGASFLGVFCGTSLPPTVRTVGNVMSVKFSSDYSETRAGFKAKYSIVTDCVYGENLTLTNSVTEGYITSPNYPGDYPNNIDCSWTITAPSTSRIQLDFLGMFNIEDGDIHCPYDYVQALEGQISSLSVLGKFCGLTLPPTVRTVGNVMTVRFYTDPSVSRTGFMAKHSVVFPCDPTPIAPIEGALSPTRPNYYQGDVITFTCNQGYELVGASNVTCQSDQAWSDAVPTCEPCAGGENLALTDSVTEGFISSPIYPGNYPNDVDCYWIITAPPTEVIQLDFVEPFEIEFYSGFSCIYDYVKVFEGQFSTSPVLATLCGTSPPPTVRTVGNVMTVLFHSDGSEQHAGFKAKYSIALKCTTPTAPINGALNPTGPNHYQDDVMTFTCNQGYELYGAASVTCQADQTWSGPVPICTPVRCQVLTAPANGVMSPLWAISYQDVVTFTCTQGYELNGASSVTCEADQQWSAPVPTCTAVLCQPLTAPANGGISPVRPISYQDVVAFTCNQGYELTGVSNLTCQADQTWSGPVPTCTPVLCQPLTAPQNGALSQAWAISYQDVIHFTCDPGYELNGASSVTCQADQQWSAPVPTCTAILCQPLTAPENGALSPAWAISYEDMVAFTCNQGYELTGASNLTCQADQTWSGPVPTCTPILCQPLAAPENGALSPAWAISYQDMVAFTCNEGYELTGASNLTCQADQTWNGPVPTCTPVLCQPLMDPGNGALSPAWAISYQDMVAFTCNQGYELNGASNLTCQADKTWSGPVPTCTPVLCQPLANPENGALSPTWAISYQDVVTFTCNQGYELTGASNLTCQADQTWSGPVPTCTPVLCQPLMAPANGGMSPAWAISYQDVVTFTCNQGYELDGASSVTCQADQQWSEPVPTCTQIIPTTEFVSTTLPETTLPETTLPETTLPETTVIETTVATTTTAPTTTLPETTLPETTLPETTLPETTLPDTTVTTMTTEPPTTMLDTTLPDTTLPDTTLPDTTLPDTTLPLTTLPATTLPETTLPETTLPETTLPDTTLPDTTLPDTTLPDTTLPDTTLPDTTLPDTTLPLTTLPATTLPETTLPETTLPETTLPDTTLPDSTLPDTTLPYTTLPETTVMTTTTEPPTTMLETTLPETTLPETTLPETTLPETTLPETVIMPATTEPTTSMLETTLPGTTTVVTTTTEPTTSALAATVPETTIMTTAAPKTTMLETTLAITTGMLMTTEITTTVRETTFMISTTDVTSTAPETTSMTTTDTLSNTSLETTYMVLTTESTPTEPATTQPETTGMISTTETTTSETTDNVPTAESTPIIPETTLQETTDMIPTTESTPTIPETTLPETTDMIPPTESTPTEPETTQQEATDMILTTEAMLTESETKPPETTYMTPTTESTSSESETTPPETTDMVPTTESTTTVPETTADMISTTEFFSTMPEATTTESADIKPTEQHPTTKYPAVSKPVTVPATTAMENPAIASTTKPNQKPVVTSTTKPTPKPVQTTAPLKEDEVGGESSSQVVIIAGAAGGGAAAVAGACAIVIIIRKRKHLSASQKLEVLDLMDLNNAKE
ncbi:CUB and sushi domain-containing protein 1-like [Branchiostoma lanceolatum]|uniref:CUB and sushi domain-containing protein 1-like n=1 Tax=Branchiostoma lanceolatum TaxID=7740 RepID=UPI0034557F6E